MLYKVLFRPLLFRRDPERTHEEILALLSRLGFLEWALESFFAVVDGRLRVQIGALSFSNPVGLAAGFDKNAIAVQVWPGFGFGFIEIGAVTSNPQPGNPKPRLFRLPEDEALINRLGFNNDGAEVVAARLEALTKNGRPRIPLGINIGRSRAVQTEKAAADYLATFERLYPFGDYFTLNVSSPNTPELRDLQERNRLQELLHAIRSKNQELALHFKGKEKPVFVKIAPDLELAQVDEIIEVARSQNVSGIIATNATAGLREKLVSRSDEPGGLSGKPLRDLATAFIRHIYRQTRGELPIIGSGGVFTASDAFEKIKAGASAVQIYTGFVYEGPAAVKRINLGLLRLIEQEGFKNLSEAIGSDMPR